MQTKIFWISFISLVLLLGCDAGKRDWQKAAEQGTITAYEEFLKKHPQHELAESARSRLEELYWDQAQYKNTIPAYEKFLENYPKSRFYEKAHAAIENLCSQRHKAFRNVRTVKVIIQDSYKSSQRYPFRPLVFALFQNFAGLQIVGTEAKAYDAIFRLESKYLPLSALYRYDRYSSKTLWTGASLKGKISLQIPGVIIFDQSFQAKKPVEPWVRGRDYSDIISKYSNPEDAPFWDLFSRSDSFLQVTVKMLGKVFGSSFLVSLVTEPNYPVIEDRSEYWWEWGRQESSIRDFAAEAINEVEGPFAVESLVKAALVGDIENTSIESFERVAPYSLLRKTRDPCAVKPLIAALKDKRFSARMNAAKLLGWLGDSRAVESLIVALNDNNWKVRSNAAWALGMIKDPRSIEPLLHVALNDVDFHAKRNALAGLYVIGDRRVVGPLITSFRNTRSLLLEERVKVLEKITGEKLGKSPMTWQNWWEQNKERYPQSG